MRLFFFGFMSLLISVVSGQVTITSSSMPSAGDTFRYVMTQPLAFEQNWQQTGASQTWEFNTSNKDMKRLDEYKNSLKTPYAFYFFNTTGKKLADTLGIGQFQLEDVYQFFKKTSTQYQVEGLGLRVKTLSALPLAGFYSEEDILFHFPLEYQNRDSSGFKVRLNIPSIGSYGQSGHRITEVVGYGKTIVVNDTFESLMVKSTVIGIDSIKSVWAGFGIPFKRVEYYWMSPDHDAPLAIITGNEVAGNFVPTQSSYMNFEPRSPGSGGGGGGGSTSISTLDDASQFFYPNPAQDRLVVDQTVTDIEVMDIQGKSLIRSMATGYLDISALMPGVYHLRLKTASGAWINTRLVKK